MTGATGFFGAGVLSTAVLMSSISFVTREALLPRSLSKKRDEERISTRDPSPSGVTRIEMGPATPREGIYLITHPTQGKLARSRAVADFLVKFAVRNREVFSGIKATDARS